MFSTIPPSVNNTHNMFTAATSAGGIINHSSTVTPRGSIAQTSAPNSGGYIELTPVHDVNSSSASITSQSICYDVPENIRSTSGTGSFSNSERSSSSPTHMCSFCTNPSPQRPKASPALKLFIPTSIDDSVRSALY